MRKSLLTILAALLILSAGSLQAAPVSQKQASKLAAKFMTRQLNLPAKSIKLVAVSKPEGYYAFNNAAGQGYVLMSADDQMPQMLAYSTKGQWNGDESQMPPALRQVLQNYATQLELIRQGKAPAPAYAADADADHTIIVEPLLTTIWSQAYPYNMGAPAVVDSIFGAAYNEHFPIGCSAIAMGQIANYWKYPQHPVDHVSSYTYEDYINGKGQTIKDYATISSATTFDYANIPDSIDLNPETSGMSQAEWEAKANAVGTLLQNIAYLLNMSWSSAGGGAKNSVGMPVAVLGLDYSFDCQTYLSEGEGKLSDLWDLIEDDLSHARPIYTGGSDLEHRVGHAFVLDGYDSQHFVHVNWGWGGAFRDMWFDPNLLGTTRYDHHEAKNYHFNASNVILHNLHPRECEESLVARNCDFAVTETLIANNTFDYFGFAMREVPLRVALNQIAWMSPLDYEYTVNLNLACPDGTVLPIATDQKYRPEQDPTTISSTVRYIDQLQIDPAMPNGSAKLYGDMQASLNGVSTDKFPATEYELVIDEKYIYVPRKDKYEMPDYDQNCIHYLANREDNIDAYFTVHVGYSQQADAISPADTLDVAVSVHYVIMNTAEFVPPFPEAEADVLLSITAEGGNVIIADQRVDNGEGAIIFRHYQNIKDKVEFRNVTKAAQLLLEPGTYTLKLALPLLGQEFESELICVGDPTAITQLPADAAPTLTTRRNLMGLPVATDYHGLVIESGKVILK